MTVPEWLVELLPPETAKAWPVIAALSPPRAALYGGTAIAAHLRHRVSRDLDVFCAEDFDSENMEAELRARGPFAATLRASGTLNGIFDEAKVQFLHARGQRILDKTTVVAGMHIAGMSDLIATKLNAVIGRGELRDYFDLKVIEQRAGRMMEEGIGLHIARFSPLDPGQQASAISRALGSFDDVGDDDTLPESRKEIVAYWTRRQPEIVTHLDQHGIA